MQLHDLVAPPVRLRLRGVFDHASEKLALRGAIAAAHLFGIATGILLRQLRAMNDPLATALAQAKEAALLHAHTALPDHRAQEPPGPARGSSR